MDMPEQHPSITSFLDDAALLLHFVEFAKNEGHVQLAAAAYAAAGLHSVDDRGLEDELKAKRDDLCQQLEGLFEEYVGSHLGLVKSVSTHWETSHSTNVQQHLRLYASAPGPHVGTEHEMYAFALSMIRGVRLSVDMQRRFQIAIAPLQSIDSFISQDKMEQSYSDALVNSLQYCCGPSIDVKKLQSLFSRRFDVPDVVGDVQVIFEDAAPGVFHRLRDLAGVPHGQYAHSLLREDVELISFGTNSKSGEFFFFSHDRLFIVKTISDKSAQKLLDMLPSYEKHLRDFPESLLVRYLGLHRIRMSCNRAGLIPERWFVIMRSAFYTSLEMHEKYDFKGSQWGRRATDGDKEKGAPMLDLDWNESKFCPLWLSPENQAAVFQQYEVDSAFLQSFDLVDYSILMGIHDRHYDPTAESRLALCRSFSMKLQEPAQGGQRKLSLQRVFTVGGHEVPCGFENSAGAHVVVFCLIDTLDPYDLSRKVQHGVGGVVTGLVSVAAGRPCEQAIVDPESYRRRQMKFFEDVIYPKCVDAPQRERLPSVQDFIE